MSVDASIRNARLRKGWTQLQLASATGISLSHLKRIESGRRRPSFEVLHRLASALDLALSDLLADPGESRAGRPAAAPPDTPDQDWLLPDWRVLQDRGRYLASVQEWEAAQGMLRAARDAARIPEERAESLAALAGTSWYFGEGGFQTALDNCFAALEALGLEPIPPQPGELPLDLLSERGVNSYGMIALGIGQVLSLLSDFAESEWWLRTAHDIGQILSQAGVHTGYQWETLHWMIRQAVYTGSRLGTVGYTRTLHDAASIARAQALIETAKEFQPRYWDSQGHQYHWEARAHALQGTDASARTSLRRAEAIFGRSSSIAEIRVDQARLTLLAGEEAEARGLAGEALEIGWASSNPRAVADSLRLLGHPDSFAEDFSTRTYRQALDLTLCALCAYPMYVNSEDGDRMVSVAVDLVDSVADDRRRFWRNYRIDLEANVLVAERPPFLFLKGLRSVEAESVGRVLDAVGARVR